RTVHSCVTALFSIAADPSMYKAACTGCPLTVMTEMPGTHNRESGSSMATSSDATGTSKEANGLSEFCPEEAAGSVCTEEVSAVSAVNDERGCRSKSRMDPV